MPIIYENNIIDFFSGHKRHYIPDKITEIYNLNFSFRLCERYVQCNMFVYNFVSIYVSLSSIRACRIFVRTCLFLLDAT